MKKASIYTVYGNEYPRLYRYYYCQVKNNKGNKSDSVSDLQFIEGSWTN